MNYKKLVLTLKNDRHDIVFIAEIHNAKNIKVDFLKLPIGTDLGFYIGRYSTGTTEDYIISDILQKIGIKKLLGHYFIREVYLK